MRNRIREVEAEAEDVRERRAREAERLKDRIETLTKEREVLRRSIGEYQRFMGGEIMKYA